MVSGYVHVKYAESLAEFGRPCRLPHCGGWILRRQIPGFPDQDALGCYPLFACQDWSQLHLDLENIAPGLVSLSLVADPFGQYDLVYLRRCFKDMVYSYKQHFIIDLHCPPSSYVSPHHRRYVRKALQSVQIELCREPVRFIVEWVNLYEGLIKRHNIKGIAVFSKVAFTKQLQIPGMVMFRAIHNSTTVGMTLWYVSRDVGYFHLAAFSPTGYELRVSFALFWQAITYFADNGLRWLNLGAGAGITNDSTDGLTRFKRGWATGTRPAYFCGRIFNHTRYSEIVRAKGMVTLDYFPAYRKGEFG